MRLIEHESVDSFLASVEGRLMAEEERNSLILSIAGRLKTGATYGEESPLLHTVEEEKGLLAAALRTPPHNLVIHCEEGRPDALEAVVERVLELDPDLPGVIGIAETAGRFARIWAERTGEAAVKAMSERLYSLRRVIPPVGVPGRMREAGKDDFDLLIEWFGAFHAEATPDQPLIDPERIVERFMAFGRVAIWDDEGPVSMAGSSRGTSNGATISAVYTPPEQRGNGYASASVAALSKDLLEEGKSFCTLFTDLSNPTSNKIYQRIGYRPVVDYAVYSFALAERRNR